MQNWYPVEWLWYSIKGLHKFPKTVLKYVSNRNNCLQNIMIIAIKHLKDKNFTLFGKCADEHHNCENHYEKSISFKNCFVVALHHMDNV